MKLIIQSLVHPRLDHTSKGPSPHTRTQASFNAMRYKGRDSASGIGRKLSITIRLECTYFLPSRGDPAKAYSCQRFSPSARDECKARLGIKSTAGLVRYSGARPSLRSTMPPVAERLRRAYPALPERACVGSIPANSDAHNVPSFRRWHFEMKLGPFFFQPGLAD